MTIEIPKEKNLIDDFFFRKMKERDPNHRLVLSYQYYYSKMMFGMQNPISMQMYENMMSIESQEEIAEASKNKHFEYEWE